MYVTIYVTQFPLKNKNINMYVTFYVTQFPLKNKNINIM